LKDLRHSLLGSQANNKQTLAHFLRQYTNLHPLRYKIDLKNWS
jgi:hypothetical protein